MTTQICARCQQSTDEPVVVALGHGASAGGHTVYACPKHASSYPQQRDPIAEIAAMYRALRGSAR